MNLATISPQARIAALVGVLLLALAGSAFVLLNGSTHPSTSSTPPAHHQNPPSTVVQVVPPTVNQLLPTPVRTALEHYPIVVVGFYNPHAPTTNRTVTEARAGAADTHVGFVAVNLLDNAVAGPLTALLPAGQLLPNPGIAIYERSGTILRRYDGYLPEAGVAQAVRESR